MWTVNLQMFKLVLEKAEEPEIKLPTSDGSSKKQEFQKNIYFCCIDYAKAFDCVDHNKLWKILKEMGIPDYLTCLLRNLYAGQEASVRTGHGTTDQFQIGKGVRQGCMLSPCLLLLVEGEIFWELAKLWNRQEVNKYCWVKMALIDLGEGLPQNFKEKKKPATHWITIKWGMPECSCCLTDTT